MQDLKKAMQQQVDRATKELEGLKEWMQKHRYELKTVLKGLTIVERWFIRMHFDGNSLDLYYAGDHHTLHGIFKAFATLGYEPSSRPGSDKVMTSFSCHFKKRHHQEDYPVFWLNFTSTKCKRVIVGSKMVSQDIYETVCE